VYRKNKSGPPINEVVASPFVTEIRLVQSGLRAKFALAIAQAPGQVLHLTGGERKLRGDEQCAALSAADVNERQVAAGNRDAASAARNADGAMPK